MKLKRLKLSLLALCALCGGGNSAYAQTDVTSTHLTNADFESSTYTTPYHPNGDRDITQPDGWSLTYTNGVSYDSSILNENQATYGNISGQVTIPGSDRGNQTYAVRFHNNGKTQLITLSQSSTFTKGKYTLSGLFRTQNQNELEVGFYFDEYSSSNRIKFEAGNATWRTLTTTFELTESTEKTIGVFFKHTSGNQMVAGVDNITLKYENTDGDKLKNLIIKATYVNTKLGSLTSAISTAQSVYNGINNTEAYQETIDEAISDLQSAINAAVSAYSLDVAGDNISWLIPNYDFESSIAETGNISTPNSSDYAETGWRLTQKGGANSSSGILTYNSGLTNNSAAISSADNNGDGGKALGISVGWSQTVTYRNTLPITLPQGSYRLVVNYYNAGTAETFTSKFGFVTTSSTEYLSSKTSFTKGEWSTETVEFTLESETEGYIQLGGSAGNNTSTNHAKLFFDNITLTYFDPLKLAQNNWAAAKAAAEAARDHDDYTNITGSERTALESAISTYGSEPDEISDCETAIEALNDATATFIAAKGSYDALAAKRTEATSNYTTAKWPYASSTKKTALDNAVAAVPTNAADAVTKTNAIVTAIRSFVESNGMAEGQANAVAKTSKLLVHDADVSTSGWTSGSIGNDNTAKYTKADGTTPGKYFNGGWAASAGVDITLTQELTLPAGDYLLQITARGSSSLDTYKMSVGAVEVNLPKNASEGGEFGNGWSDKFLTFTSDGSAVTLTITASSEAAKQWISFDRLRLTRINVSTLATADDYSNLNSAINTVEGKFGFEEGEYAPYNNVTGINKLAEVKAINQEVNNAQDEIRAWTTYLNTSSNWTANAAEVDAIYNGNMAIPNGNNPEGWSRQNNYWGQQITGIDSGTSNGTAWYYNQNGSSYYGNTGVYTMPLKANTLYCLSFKYRSHATNSNTGMSASVLNESSEGLASTAFGKNSSATDFVTVTKVFKTGAAGDYVLTLTNSGNTHFTDVSILKATALTINDTDADVLKGFTNEVDITVNRKLVADKWQGFSLPFSLTAEEIAASALNGASIAEFDSDKDNTGTVIYFKEATAIVAGVPYLIKPAEGDDIESMTFTGKTIAAGVEAQTIGEEGDYQFAAQLYYDTSLPTDGTIAYMSTGEGNKVKKLISGGSGIKGTRAYFIIPSGVAPARIVFEGDEVTSIDGTEFIVQDSAKDVYYDLQGRKVTGKPTQRGIYIVNGKKMFVK